MESIHGASRTLVVGAIGVLVGACSQPETSAAARHALGGFAGTWQIVETQPPGSAKGAEYLVFRADSTYAALGADRTELWAGTFDLDPTATPGIWDHRSDEAAADGGDVLGIYRLDGDELELGCVVGVWNGGEWSGKPRPSRIVLPEVDVKLSLRRVR